MKQTLKIFVTVLVISLAICSFAFVTSAETATKPEVVSANISYEGDYAILLAVDAASVKGGKVTVEVWKNGEKLDETFSDTTPETIKAIDSTLTKTYYVVKTPGVAQKDMDKEFTYKVTDGEGNFTEGKISVAEYFYTRLFVNGIINATEADEADFVRRDFYIDTLEQAAKAQNLLYNYNDKADDDISIFVTDLLYANIPGFDKALVDNNTTKVTLPGTGNYTVTKYAAKTFAKTETTVAAGEEITIDAHTVAVATENAPVEKPFEFGQGQFFNDSELSGATRFEYTSSGTGASGDLKGGDTVGAVDGKLVFQRNDTTGESSSYMRWNFTTFTGGENEPVFVYETDFMFDGYVVPDATAGSRIGRFDFRVNNSAIANSFKELIIYANEVGEGGIINSITIGLLELEADKWYNIGFVLDYTANEVEYFLNGVSIGTEAIGNKTTGTTNRSIWYFEAGQTEGSMNFDNTVIATYDANPPVGGDFYRSDNEGIRYNDNDLLAELDGKPAENVNANAVMEDGKLAFNQNGASGPAIRWEHGQTAEGLTTPVFVYEADMSFDLSGSNSSAGYIKFYANGVYCFVELQYWQDSMYIKCGSTITLSRGQEYNVRFEVDYENSTIKCFIDGVLKGTNTFTPESNSSTHVTIEYRSTNVSTGKITVDNLYMGMVEDGTATN